MSDGSGIGCLETGVVCRVILNQWRVRAADIDGIRLGTLDIVVLNGQTFYIVVRQVPIPAVDDIPMQVTSCTLLESTSTFSKCPVPDWSILGTRTRMPADEYLPV